MLWHWFRKRVMRRDPRRESYDPAWLVQAAESQFPDKPWLAEALSKCTQGDYAGGAYIHFLDPSHPNEPGSQWQFKENIVLEATREGDVILDILKDGRVGGVEFLNRLK